MIHLQTASQKTQPPSFQEDPIKTIPPEILEHILFLIDENENTRFVSRDWQSLSLSLFKKSKSQEVENNIRLLTEQFNPTQRDNIISYFQKLLEIFQLRSENFGTYAKVQRIFLIFKGEILYRLRYQTQIPSGLPNSLKNVFEIAKLNINSAMNVDLETFFTLLQSYPPLSQSNRGSAVIHATDINKIEFIKLLLADGPISEDKRKEAVEHALREHKVEIANLLQADKPILEKEQGYSGWDDIGFFMKVARKNSFGKLLIDNYLNLIKSLAKGPISESDRQWVLDLAQENGNQELIRFLDA